MFASHGDVQFMNTLFFGDSFQSLSYKWKGNGNSLVRPNKFGQKVTGHSDKKLEQLPNVFSMVVIKLKVNSLPLKGLTACALVAV